MDDFSMYVCPECKKVFKVKGSDKKVNCPQCKISTLVDLKIEYDEWNSLSKTTREDIIRVKLGKKESKSTSNTESETNPIIEDTKRKSFFDEVEGTSDSKTSSRDDSWAPTHDVKEYDNAKDINANNANQKAPLRPITPRFIVIGSSIAVVVVIGIIAIGLIKKNKLSTDSPIEDSNTISNIVEEKKEEVSQESTEKDTKSEINVDETLDFVHKGDLLQALEGYRTLSSEDQAKVDADIMENITDYAHFISRLSVEKGMSKAKECLEEMAPVASENVEFQQGVFSEVMILLNNDNASDAMVLKNLISDKTLINDFYNACYNIANENLVNGICDRRTSSLYGFLPKDQYPDGYAFKQLVDLVIDIREKPAEIPVQNFPIIVKADIIDYCPEDCKNTVNAIKTELEQMSGCYSNGTYYIAIKNYRLGLGDTRSSGVYGRDATYNKNNHTFYVLINNIKKSGDSLDVDGKIYNRVAEKDCPITFNEMDIAGTEAIRKPTKHEDKMDPFIGMDEQTLTEKSWGKPQKKNVTEHPWGTYEQWVYSTTRYVYLENGIVTAIQYSK